VELFEQRQVFSVLGHSLNIDSVAWSLEIPERWGKQEKHGEQDPQTRK
jgi:hypothetical protein